MSDEEIDQILNQVDTDGSGNITYSEFIAATIDKTKLLTEENLKTSFNAFDISKTGFINSKDLKITLQLAGSDAEQVI